MAVGCATVGLERWDAQTDGDEGKELEGREETGGRREGRGKGGSELSGGGRGCLCGFVGECGGDERGRRFEFWRADCGRGRV